jgi:uncharacterized protein HemY
MYPQMTSEERIALKITAAAAIMKVSKEEAARRLDESLGPHWRERLRMPVPEPRPADQSVKINATANGQG